MLVSVVVITYNSSRFIFETLESIRKQDFQNIQLVISDDCSTDDTVDICKKWLYVNRNRFINPKIVVLESNKGVPSNLNNAIKYCEGEWIKLLAGDDLLKTDCISNNINYLTGHPNVNVVFSKLISFRVKNNKYIFQDLPDRGLKEFFNLSTEQQLVKLYKGNILPAPTVFLKKDIVIHYPFNEKYKLIEDFPMWINLLKNNVRFDYFDKITVCYRKSESLSYSSDYFVNSSFEYYKRLHFYDELCNELYFEYPDIYEDYLKRFFINDFCVFLLHNKKNLIAKIIYKLLKRRLRKK